MAVSRGAVVIRMVQPGVPYRRALQSLGLMGVNSHACHRHRERVCLLSMWGKYGQELQASNLQQYLLGADDGSLHTLCRMHGGKVPAAALPAFSGMQDVQREGGTMCDQRPHEESSSCGEGSA